MKRILLTGLFSLIAIIAKPQFVTIMGQTETLVNDTTIQDFEPVELSEAYDDETDEENDEQNTAKGKKGIKKLFKRIGKWIGISEGEEVKDTVPIDPAMFSYDVIDKEGAFIFTEADEKRYLDSVKYELIKRRHQVLKRKTMVSMPMNELKVTSYFGYRKDPFTKDMKFHNGIDFAAHDCFIYAVLPGIVVQAGYRGGYGYCIELKHGDIHTLYAHLSYILVRRNQPVPAGEPIGISGTTGRSTGEHLHFSIMNKGKYIDPMPMLDYLSGIIAEEETYEEDFYLPSYSELRGKDAKGQPVNKANSITADTTDIARPDNDLAPKRTSGMILLPEENREEVTGKVYGQGQKDGLQGNKQETGLPVEAEKTEVISESRIIHYSGKDEAAVIGKQGEGTQTKSAKGSSFPLKSEPAKPKSGIILPEGDTVVNVKPLVGKK